MKTVRNIAVSAILALSAGGSILASAAVPAVTAGAPAGIVAAAGSHANPASFYHG